MSTHRRNHATPRLARRLAPKLIAGVLATGLLLTGCGDDKDTASDSTTKDSRPQRPLPRRSPSATS
ncbi:MAG: hypothetical protein V9G12_06515 [Microthrixaceae bacterium]